MNKIEEAKEILKELGLPPPQQNEISALTLLALCNLRKNDIWSNANRKSLGISKGIMSFIKQHYGKNYAPNTRETFRRQVLHQFVQARIVDYNPDNPNLPVNSPRAHYAISEAALNTIHYFKTRKWEKAVKLFISQVGALTEAYVRKREAFLIPVKLSNGRVLKLSPGKHNEVQAAIVEQFAPRFAKGGILIYLGDTAKKDLYVNEEAFKGLGIPIDKHSKLPDVVIYEPKKKWLFLIEAVTSHGPVSPKRLLELEEFLKNCMADKIYVTAFPDFTEFKKRSPNIAWETEVWIVDAPDHMIHFNGDKFMGPR
ncbi:MAG: restriction endonuclease [Cytophagales bacterium]|nr:restriction endonuclease [Cytophagales bacterium]